MKIKPPSSKVKWLYFIWEAYQNMEVINLNTFKKISINSPQKAQNYTRIMPIIIKFSLVDFL